MSRKKGKSSAKPENGDKSAFPTLSCMDSVEELGRQIGPYKLLSVLGEGGFGIVYRAEQKEPIRRQVALKVIKPGMDSKQVIARFETERQALALLDHPNIAYVFEAGTTEAGRPYFVMEYVKGESFTMHCDRKKLDIEERLELFLQVCEAVQHAHQKGIIHRDIKPSNILVSVQENKAIPKIIDFGIAKAISQPLTERTLFTEQGQLLGTPEYMSPEQAELTSRDIDTRSDIYSLGVLLYELLSGTLPFDPGTLRKAAFDEVLRTIRDEDPPRPSTRLSGLGEKAKKVAESRHTEIAALTKRLHKELEWIPLKAMRKEPDRRYKTASELADDVRNYLNGNPLIAGPESVTYRFRKFAHKHTGPIVSVAAVLAVLIIGFAVSTRMYLRAEKNADAYLYELYVNYIAQAQNALQENNLLYAQEYLEKCPENLRGWEWYHLSHVTEQSNVVFKGHSESVLSVAISNDGSKIASGSADYTVRLWDADDGRELHTFKGHSSDIQCVIFNHNATRIFSGSSDDTIKIWDNNGRNIRTLQGHRDDVKCLAVSPDNKKIISGSLDDTIKIWDVSTGKVIETISDHKGDVRCLVISPDGERIVSGSRDKTIRVRNISNGETSVLVCDAEIESLAVSPDGNHIVSGGNDGFIRIWDLQKKKVVKQLEGHSAGISAVGFSSDGELIVSASYDRNIRIWHFDSADVDSTNQVAECKCRANSITAAAFTPDDKRVIWGSLKGTVNAWVWDIEADSKIKYEPEPLYEHADGISSVAISPVDNFIALGGTKSDAIAILNAENLLRIKEWKHGTGVDTPRGTLGEVYGVTVIFSPDGKRLASGSIDGTVKIWDAKTGNELRCFTEHEDWIASLAFSPDGKLLVSGSGDATLKIWNTFDVDNKSSATFGGYQRKKSETFGFSYPACAVFSSDGKKIVSGGPGGIIKIWDAKGNEIGTMKGRHSEGIISVSFSPDNAYVASGGFDNTVKIWSVDDCMETGSLAGHTGLVLSVSFSPNGRRIISSSEDETVKVWDPFNRHELITLRGHDGPVKTAIFSRDGKKIITGGLDKKIYIWESNGSGKAF